ncbi:MAG: phosphoserine phosphatase SerB [Candidatus Planktophila sp.]
MDKTRAQYTGLILVSGEDRPGITEALFQTLAPFSLSIIDIEQVVIRSRLILTILIALDPAHADAVEEDVARTGADLDLDVAMVFSEEEGESIAAKTGLTHVVVLSQDLKPAALSAVASKIAQAGGNIERIHRTASYPVTAIECVVSGVESVDLKNALTPLAAQYLIDIAVSPGGLMRWAKKLVLMDVDSTLISQEVIELLGEKAGVADRVKEITDRAMAGELDFEASLRERVSLLKGLPATVLEEVREAITLTPGAKTLVSTMQKLGHTIAVVSGGFIDVIEPLLQSLNIVHYRANTLEIIDGHLSGNLTGPIIDRAAKAQALREFALIEKVELEQTVAIGDGANDLDMIALAGLGIAFNAKPAVRAAADSALSAPYLDSVLYLLGISREDVEESGHSSRK